MAEKDYAPSTYFWCAAITFTWGLVGMVVTDNRVLGPGFLIVGVISLGVGLHKRHQLKHAPPAVT